MCSVRDSHIEKTRKWLGFPIRTSPDQSLFADSPRLFAGFNVLHRLQLPRHPPNALVHLTIQPKPRCSSQPPLAAAKPQQRGRRARARAFGNMVGERSPDFTRGRNDPRRTTTTRRTRRRADALFNFKLVSIPRKSAHLDPPGRSPTNTRRSSERRLASSRWILLRPAKKPKSKHAVRATRLDSGSLATRFREFWWSRGGSNS